MASQTSLTEWPDASLQTSVASRFAKVAAVALDTAFVVAVDAWAAVVAFACRRVYWGESGDSVAAASAVASVFVAFAAGAGAAAAAVPAAAAPPHHA